MFIDDGTFCPGFQFTDQGRLQPAVTGLFRHAMDLKIPHNYFTAWMVTPAKELNGSRPVECLTREPQLHHALESFAGQLSGARRAN